MKGVMIFCVILLFSVLPVSGESFLYSDSTTPHLGETNVIQEIDGWIEYIDNDYNTSNRLTIGATLMNFSMSNYSVRDKELPNGVYDDTWFNGTHILTDKAGNSFIIRWRYSSEPQGANAYCEAFFNIGNPVGQLPLRLITFPKGNGIEQIGTFTNVEYTLDTWLQNGAFVQIQCPVADVEFWDIQLTIERTYIGKGVY